jgi:hypothetical protein
VESTDKSASSRMVVCVHRRPMAVESHPLLTQSNQAIAEDGLRALLPRGYPRSVQKGYAEYVLRQIRVSCLQ